jgi:hypothetical protein
MTRQTNTPSDLPGPETADEKEVYAFYGLASYEAQAVEGGLIQLALLLRLRNVPEANQAAYDREYEAIARLTFGHILKRLTTDQTLGHDLRALLERALQIRNHLTHHFFWDHREDWFTQEGRLLMIEKLREAIRLFSDVDEMVVGTVDEMLQRLGVGPETISQMFEKLLHEARRKYHGT